MYIYKKYICSPFENTFQQKAISQAKQPTGSQYKLIGWFPYKTFLQTDSKFTY